MFIEKDEIMVGKVRVTKAIGNIILNIRKIYYIIREKKRD